MFEAVREVNNPDIDARGFGAGVFVSVWWRWWRGGVCLGGQEGRDAFRGAGRE